MKKHGRTSVAIAVLTAFAFLTFSIPYSFRGSAAATLGDSGTTLGYSNSGGSGGSYSSGTAANGDRVDVSPNMDLLSRNKALTKDAAIVAVAPVEAANTTPVNVNNNPSTGR